MKKGAVNLLAEPTEVDVKPRAFLLPLILFLLALLFATLAFLVFRSRQVGEEKPTRHTLSAEMPAPDFSLPAQDGRIFHLKNYKGRAVFLAFLPTVSDPETVGLLRSLNATLPEYEKAGAKVLALTPEGPEVTRAVYQREKLNFPILTDAGDAVRRAYTVPNGHRTTFVVDPKGKIKFRIGQTIIEPARHGRQIVEISECCLEDVIAARSGGIGKPVGDYSLPRADTGAMETIYGEGNQLATVVLFISTKCPCSNSYNDRMRKIAEDGMARGVRFVAVYANADETAAEIANHMKEHRFPFVALRDARQLGADHFKATVTPQVFVLDSKRILRYAGRIDDSRDFTDVESEELRQAIDAVLTNKTPPAETNPFGCSIVR